MANVDVLTPVRRQRRARAWRWERDHFLATASVILFLSVWEAAYRLGHINPLFSSAPSRIALAAANLFSRGQIWHDIYVSGSEFLMGYGLSVLVGIPLGVLIGWYPTVRACLDPFITVLYTTPRVALLPLLIIWFGIGPGSKVAVVFLSSVFQILVNTATGVRNADPQLVKAARSFGAKDLHVFTTVALPGSVPYVLSGLRLAVSHGLIGVVVGELYAASAGVGYLIATAGATFQTDKVFVGIAIIVIFGLLTIEGLKWLERRFEAWRPAQPR